MLMSDVKGRLTPCKEAFPAERIRPRTVFVTPRTGQEDAAESPEGLGILISLSLTALICCVQKPNGGPGERIRTHEVSGWRPVIPYSEPQVAMPMNSSALPYSVLPPKYNSRISFTLLFILPTPYSCSNLLFPPGHPVF